MQFQQSTETGNASRRIAEVIRKHIPGNHISNRDAPTTKCAETVKVPVK